MKAADVERAKARLRDEFPGWSIIRSDRGRWWAVRQPEPDPMRHGRFIQHEVSSIDSVATPEELRARLREVAS